MQLTQVEAAFKSMKSDLGIRPIYHQLEHRVEAHVFIAFLSYCLQVTLKNRIAAHASGLDKLAGIRMLDVWLPATDGRFLVMPRHAEPDHEQALLLHKLNLQLPPSPRIRAKAASAALPRSKMQCRPFATRCCK